MKERRNLLECAALDAGHVQAERETLTAEIRSEAAKIRGIYQRAIRVGESVSLEMRNRAYARLREAQANLKALEGRVALSRVLRCAPRKGGA